MIPYFYKYLRIVSLLEFEFNFPLQFAIVFFLGSESPAPFLTDSRQMEGERIRQMAKRLIGPDVAEKQLSNEISAPYEVPQYPIEQIETKLIRYVHSYVIICFAYLFRYNPEKKNLRSS